MISTEELENALNNNIEPDELLKQIHNMTFVEYFDYLLKKYNLEKKDVVKVSGIERTYAYKIMNGTKQNTSKDKVFRLALAMKLSQKETNHLLSLSNAGELYPQVDRDLILLRGLVKHQSVMTVNEELEKRGLKTLD